MISASVRVPILPVDRSPARQPLPEYDSNFSQLCGRNPRLGVDVAAQAATSNQYGPFSLQKGSYVWVPVLHVV